VMCSA